MATPTVSPAPHSPPRTRQELRGRIIIGAILLTVILAAILAPPLVLTSILAVATALGSYEVFENTVGRQLKGLQSYGPAAAVCVLFAATIPVTAHLTPRLYWINLALAALALVLLGFSAHQHLWRRYRPTRPALVMSVFIAAWAVGGTLGALVPIRLSPHGSLWLLVILGLNVASDTGAFIVGRTWDKFANYRWTPQRPRHRPCPTISPSKTWAGFIGGAGATLAIGGILAFRQHDANYIILALAIAIMAPLGDLFASWLKRRLSIKDWSCRLGPHGGFLDRLDSLTWAATAAYVVLVIAGHVPI